MIAPCTDKINKLVLKNYCYMVFVGQTDLLCTLVQTFIDSFIKFLLTAIPGLNKFGS